MVGIESFVDDGTPIVIEIKTTKGPITTPFFVSENERRVAAETGPGSASIACSPSASIRRFMFSAGRLRRRWRLSRSPTARAPELTLYSPGSRVPEGVPSTRERSAGVFPWCRPYLLFLLDCQPDQPRRPWSNKSKPRTMTCKERLFPDHSMIVAAQSSQQDYRRKDWTSAATRASLLITLGF